MPIRITCLCGKTSVELHGEPAARANCHCAACRDFYGTAMLSATAWHADAVRPTQNSGRIFRHPVKQLSKTFCAECAEVMFGTNRLGMRVVPNAIVARTTGGTLDAHLVPTMHLFYRHRVIDIADTLPKFLDGWDGPLYDAS